MSEVRQDQSRKILRVKCLTPLTIRQRKEYEMIPVGTKVMIMSETYPKYNGVISTVMKALQKGDYYKCRASEVDLHNVKPESYILQDVFTGFCSKTDCNVEVFWRRSSLRVIDDKPCGQSFEEVMELLKQPSKC